jgi:nitrogenase molybdenum-iron protein alpha/beta subunit
MDTQQNNKINIVTPMISPADTRYLKNLLSRMGIDYILLPDISENLDGVHSNEYNSLPGGGTSIQDIAKMGKAKMTIELSSFIDNNTSVGQYLNEKYGVPFVRMQLPVSLKDTDAFINKLAQLGAVIPTDLIKERGRLVDAMIDSHKYNAEGRAVIYGEPDLVFSASRLCCENGIIPVVSATGSVCPNLKYNIIPDIKNAAKLMIVEKYSVIDDADFDTIEKLMLEFNANIMIEI